MQRLLLLILLCMLSACGDKAMLEKTGLDQNISEPSQLDVPFRGA